MTDLSAYRRGSPVTIASVRIDGRVQVLDSPLRLLDGDALNLEGRK